MPNIPVPTQQEVFSNSRMPYQDIQANPNAFGANIGEAEQQSGQRMDQTSNVLDQVAMHEKQVNDDTATGNAFLQFNSQFDSLMGQYRNLQGQDAVAQKDAYQQKMYALQSQIKSTLGDAQQQINFDQISRRMMMWNMQGMDRYAAEQNQAYQRGTSNALANTFAGQAVKNVNNPQAFQLAINSLNAEIDGYAQQSGMSPEEAAFRRQAFHDQVVLGGVRQLLTSNNAMAAQQFYYDHQDMVDYRVKPEIESLLRTGIHAQYAVPDGKAAVDSIAVHLGQPSSSPLPENFGASNVHPYTQQDLDRLSGLVKKPSQYDDLFKAVGAQYNIPWQELKLRAVVESGLNPGETSQQGAVGLMQLMPATAKALGVDPKDPKQAIIGAAKILAGAGGTNGGNWADADRAYYGGSVDAQGKNTDQYVSNVGALRHALWGAQSPSNLTMAAWQGAEGAVLAKAQEIAEQRRPGDETYAGEVMSEAHAQWMARLSVMQNTEHANMSKIMDSIQQGGYMSLGGMPADLQQQYSQLTPQDKESIQTLFYHQVKAANGEYMPSDPKVVMNLSNRINLPPGNPMRINNASQLSPYIAHGLNFTDFQHLTTELKDANDPGTSQFMRQVNQVKQTAYKMLTGSMSSLAIQHPDLAYEAAYRFSNNVDQLIQKYEAQHKDVQSLFTPGSPDYVLAPNRVASFMPSDAQAAAAAAGGGAQQSAVPYPTATNPKTHQRMMYKDGQWQAMQ